ncbi:MAG: hypothetical protein ACFFD5_13265 [Candidatus Thorarchaeota archaeon]
MRIRNFLISFGFINFIIILGILPQQISAYWGWGDCGESHGITYMKPYYEKNAVINLDGIPSEQFWSNPSNTNGSTTVALASEVGTPGFFIVYMNLSLVMNDNYLYILCQWLDNTTRPALGGNYYDGLYFCWNINVPNFSAYFLGGMDTSEMGGGNVDCWDWTCLSSSPPNGSSYYCSDLCFGTTGWYNPSLETEDIQVGYNYVINHSYSLEMRRKLIDNDNYDVQFNGNKLYKFNMGIMNDGTHEDHAISWTYALDLRNEEKKTLIDGYLIYFVIVIGFISSFLLIIQKKYEIQII